MREGLQRDSGVRPYLSFRFWQMEKHLFLRS